jgi:hypothetical protein
MAAAAKAPAPADFAARAEAVRRLYGAWLENTQRKLPLGTKLRRGLARLYRSKGERRRLADYYKADLTVEIGTVPLATARDRTGASLSSSPRRSRAHGREARSPAGSWS